MINKADIVYREVSNYNCVCDSGHEARGTFRRNGPESKPEPIRFFKISTSTVSGIYCEPCLVIANHIARLKRKK